MCRPERYSKIFISSVVRQCRAGLPIVPFLRNCSKLGTENLKVLTAPFVTAGCCRITSTVTNSHSVSPAGLVFRALALAGPLRHRGRSEWIKNCLSEWHRSQGRPASALGFHAPPGTFPVLHRQGCWVSWQHFQRCSSRPIALPNEGLV